MVRTRIKARIKTEWNRILYKEHKKAKALNKSNYLTNYPPIISKQLKIPPGISKKVSSSFFQLKTGHGYFNHYLYRFNLRKWPLCSCGEIQTPRHLILYCIWYKEIRKEAFKDIKAKPPKLPFLFLTQEGRLALLQFIKTTHISSRTWILEGDEEEAEGVICPNL